MSNSTRAILSQQKLHFTSFLFKLRFVPGEIPSKKNIQVYLLQIINVQICEIHYNGLLIQNVHYF